MTEEEAKTKICVHQPFELHEAVPNHNTFQIEAHIKSVVPKCVGSECMAWREVSDIKVVDAKENAPEGYDAVAGNELMTLCTRSAGYCGLAGKP